MIRITPLISLAWLLCHLAWAEGTHELAPNGSITISGNTTTDLAALHINHPSYNNFASYTNPDPQARLYIHITNPATECIYVGFSFGHPNVTSPNPPQINFEFRIKDPNGNVVFGPVTVTPAGTNIKNWAEGYNGPMQLHGPGGYPAIQATSADLGSQGWTGKGDYYIEFSNEDNSDFLVDFWDISVADCSGPAPVEKKGRLWSYNWSIFAVNDFGFPNRPFNGAFYVCAPDPDNEHASFVTRIDFNQSGFRPAAFNIAFNSFGSMNTGNVMEDRKSVQNTNATRAEYAIFLNDPVEICETAEIGAITLLGVSRCNGEDYCIKFIASKAGQVEILLDFNGGDNIYTPGTADLMIAQTVSADQVGIPTCIAWDGKDGLGQVIPETPGTQIPVTIGFAQGIYHFPIYDAEFMTNGVTVQAVRPVAPNPLLYYDDSNISVPSGSGEPSVQLSGCVTPCHRWTNYTQPNTPGFGNLHTINSWWFSQLIVRQDVFFLPAYYTCEIEGPSHFCFGGTSSLTVKPTVIPAGAEDPQIINYTWNGPGIIGFNGNTGIELDQPGDYSVEVIWVTGLGDTCSTSCTYTVGQDPPLTAQIDTLILAGDEIHINGIAYDEGGQYIQNLTTTSGCDSILTITIKVINTVVHYDLNACESFMSNGSHMDYSEFIPAYPQPLSCAELSGSTVYRTPPQTNKHSCTQGVNNTIAMCVSSLDGCEYIAGHEASVLFTLTITPDPDTAVQITGLQFYSQAPATYNWISGSSGVNNYPTRFGLRVLKNGTEIYRLENIATTQVWTLETFDFSDDKDFIIDGPATFTFELLPYCLIGNGSDVAAWDMDEINLQASCVSPEALNPLIAGVVRTPAGRPVPGAGIRLSTDAGFAGASGQVTNTAGKYQFDAVPRKKEYYLKGDKDGDDLNGVSTLDLIHMQRHLLGMVPFTEPWQYIAADANRSNSVSALDLVELRKLILGIYSELPRNASWRIFDAQATQDISQPWLMEDKVHIEYLTEDQLHTDFTGIKIGDLNGDVELDASPGLITNREQLQLRLDMQDRHLTAGEITRIDISTRDRYAVSGMQLGLIGDDVEILGILAGQIPLEASNYHDNHGHLRISWDSPVSITTGDGKILFSLYVRSLVDGHVDDLIHLEQTSFNPEAYVGLPLDKAEIQLHYIQGTDDPGTFTYLRVMPNPLRDMATLEFELVRAETVHFQFFDVAGHALKEIWLEGTAGLNQLRLQAAELGLSEGMVICRLQTDAYQATQKLIVTKY